MTAKRWFRDFIQRLANMGSGRAGTPITATSVLDRYVTTLPSHQNAIDSIPGWSSGFPRGDLTAGITPAFADQRIHWCLESFGSLDGKSVLELGPLEGLHTYMLAEANPAHIDAIEANELAFMRCLITKQVLDLRSATFLLGDFNRWMEQPGRAYDLVVASGVLYHSADPIRLIELIAQSAGTGCFYLWTHYFDEEAMPRRDLRRVPFSGKVDRRAYGDLTVELHERSYYKAWRDPKFCGGLQDRHFWMTKAGILGIIDALGFATETAHDEPGHVNGPSFSVFARRR